MNFFGVVLKKINKLKNICGFSLILKIVDCSNKRNAFLSQIKQNNILAKFLIALICNRPR